MYYCAVLASGSTAATGLPVRLPTTDDRLWMDIAEELTASPRKLFKRILSAEAALKTTKVCPDMRHTSYRTSLGFTTTVQHGEDHVGTPQRSRLGADALDNNGAHCSPQSRLHSRRRRCHRSTVHATRAAYARNTCECARAVYFGDV